MADEGRAELRHQLGADVPAVELLTDEDAARLATLIATARRQQAEDLATAAEHGMEILPRPLRAPVRRMLEP